MRAIDVKAILLRVQAAPPSSPIAVFDTGGTELDVVFADTLETRRRIRLSDRSLVGIYDNSMNMDSIRDEIREVIRRNKEEQRTL